MNSTRQPTSLSSNVYSPGKKLDEYHASQKHTQAQQLTTSHGLKSQSLVTKPRPESYHTPKRFSGSTNKAPLQAGPSHTDNVSLLGQSEGSDVENVEETSSQEGSDGDIESESSDDFTDMKEFLATKRGNRNSRRLTEYSDSDSSN